MRTSWRRAAGFIAAGAFAFLLFGASEADADIVAPKSADQPISTSLLDSMEPASGTAPAPEASPQPAPPMNPEPVDEQSAAEPAPAAVEEQPTPASPPPAAAEPSVAQPHGTPAPEVVMMKSAVRHEAVVPEMGAVFDERLEQPRGFFDSVIHNAKVFLGQVATACQVGVASASGVPAVALAILSTVALLERRWMRMARPVGDDEAPEFLYAWDVIAPG